MNSEYIRQAYLRTILSELQKYLLDKFISMDGSPKETLLCEDVLYKHREVTQDALLDVLDKLVELEGTAKAQMAGYEFRKDAGNVAGGDTGKASVGRKKA